MLYRDPERQFRLELWLSYLSRIDEDSRSRLPWPDDYLMSQGFLASVDELVRSSGISREKIVETCAEVLCGQAKEMANRAVKEWRSSKRGPVLLRDDGAVAMRVRLQTGTSAARRLRCWRLPSGQIELDWVGSHDEGIL